MVLIMTSKGVMPCAAATSAISRVLLVRLPSLRPAPGLAPPLFAGFAFCFDFF